MELKEIVLPWLVDDLNSSLAIRYVRESDVITHDNDREFYRCVSEGREVETWEGKTFTCVNYREEEPKIGVDWFGDVVNHRNKSLYFEDGGFYPNQLEGEEQTYIEKFVERVTNPEINPLGFRLKDGVYGSPQVKFDICFGLSGNSAHLKPLWPEGWNLDPLSLPWEMRIAVHEDIQSIHPKNKHTDVVKAGVYDTFLKQWERNPACVSTMKLEGESEYYLDEVTFLHYVVAGKIYILDIMVDERRRY